MALRYLFLFILILFLFGCPPGPQRMYSGPRLEPAKESTIRVQDPTGDKKLRIVLVDAKTTVGFFKRMFTGWAVEVKVPPGKHDVRLIFNAGLFQGWGDLWIVTCPGKTYIAKWLIQGYQGQMWFEEKETGKRVGGN